MKTLILLFILRKALKAQKRFLQINLEIQFQPSKINFVGFGFDFLKN